MIPLASHRRVWTLLGLCKFDENMNIVLRMLCISFNLSLFISFAWVVVASAMFVMNYLATDLEGSLHALFQLTGYTGLIYVSIIAVVVRHKITNVFQTLTNLYDATTDADSYRYLVQANNKSEWMWQFYFKIMLGTASNTFILAWLSARSVHSTYGRYDEKYLYHPYKVVLPWDCETAIGYAGEIIFHTYSGQGYIFFNGTLLLLFIAICLHHVAFFKTHKKMLETLETVDKKRDNQKFLSKLINFQVTIRSLMIESSEAYSPFILVQLICLTVCIACIFFELDSQMQHINMDVSILLIALGVTAANPFLYCLYSKRTSDNYLKMADHLFESGWPLLPVELQKNFIFMIRNMQKPLYYHGFGVVILDLETFQGIFRKVITYYMAFKALTD